MKLVTWGGFEDIFDKFLFLKGVGAFKGFEGYFCLEDYTELEISEAIYSVNNSASTEHDSKTINYSIPFSSYYS